MITEIKETNLIAVEVAADAEYFSFGLRTMGMVINRKDIFYDTKENVWHQGNIVLPEGNFKIIGIVTKDKIGFDVTKLPDMLLTTEAANNLLGKNDKINFYKLLAANGLYFENPITHPISLPYSDSTSINEYEYKRMVGEWLSYESKLVQKLLIIEKN